MGTENSKANESNKFIYKFTDKLNLKTPNKKNIGLADLSNCYTWKNIKSTKSNNSENFSFNLEWQTWFAWWFLLNFWHSRLLWIYHQKHKTLVENPPIKIYANKIKNSIVFKIKTGYKLELLSQETRKLLGNTKKRCW